MTNEPELLTSVEAAQITRTPLATLRYWRHLGIGPRSFRIGRRVVYRKTDLHEWITSEERRTASPSA